MTKGLFFLLLTIHFTSYLNGQTIERSYDVLGRLKGEVYPDSSAISYTYDNMGNLIGLSLHDPCSTKPKPVITISGPLTFCAGDSVFLSTLPGLKYSWSTGDTTQTVKVLAGGIYRVTRLDTFSIPDHDTLQCLLVSDSVVINVKPIPDVILPPSQIKCNGDSTSPINFTGTTLGTIYSWTNGNTNIGLANTGIGNILPFTAINSTNIPVFAIVSVTPTANGCSDTAHIYTITVNPMPNVLADTNQTICSRSATRLINFTSTVAGTTFTWSNNNTSIGLANTDTGNIKSFTALNSTMTPVIATISVIPSFSDCIGIADSLTITVKPTPTVVTPLNQGKCNGHLTDPINFLGSIIGSKYTWSNNNTTIGLPSADTGNIASFVLTNSTSASVTATVTVVATFNGCSDISHSFTITASPIPALSSTLIPPAICDSTVFNYRPTSSTIGTIFTWSRAAIIGISNPAANGTGNPNEVLINTTLFPIPVMYVDTLSANGCINIQNIPVVVNPKPTLSSPVTLPPICDSTLFNYTPTSTIKATSIAWSRKTIPGISNPPATGSDSIHEVLINVTPNPIAVIYTDTLNANGCSSMQDVQVTVNPKPVLSSPLSPTGICHSATFSYTPTSATSGVIFTWTRAAITGIANPAASGVDNPNEVLVNTTSNPIAVIYSYSLTANGCMNVQDVQVIVNPEPRLSSTLTPFAICSGTKFSYVPASTTIGTLFIWSRAVVPGISNPATKGIGNPNEILINVTPDPIVVTYVDTLAINGCINTQNVTVTVNPKPILSSILVPTVICDSTLFSYIPTSSTIGTSFTWSRSVVPGITNPYAFGVDNPNEILINTTPNPIVVLYVYTLVANSCSDIQNIPIIINPKPKLSSPLNPPGICDSTLFSYPPSSLTTGTIFSWSRAIVTGISNLPANGVDNPNEVLINTTVDTVTVIYVDTLIANGCMNMQNVSVVVNPTPWLSSPLILPNICDGALFNYTSTSPTPGISFAWSRGVISGISNPLGKGIGMISEILMNSTPDPILVTYVDTLIINGCINTENVMVTINPTPVLNSSVTPLPICDSTIFSYSPSSATIATTFSWSRSAILGISNPPGSGIDNPNEVLINSTLTQINVPYVYMLTANGCLDTQTVSVTVNPQPHLTNTDTSAICSGSIFRYSHLSTIPGTSFSWMRQNISGIIPSINNGSGDISETLYNTTFNPIHVIYIDTLTVFGCSTTQPILLTINPVPETPRITTKSPPELCANTQYQNFGTSNPAPAGVDYSWTATNANVWAQGFGKQYCLVSFPALNTTAVITLSANVDGINCFSKDTFLVDVGLNASANSEVIYDIPQFICLTAMQDSYQWGYDDVRTLDSTILPGEINQHYVNKNPDFIHKYYWVITQHNGCIQKSYKNVPEGISTIPFGDKIIVDIYPNPTNNIVNVDILTSIGGKFKIVAFDQFGQKVISVFAVNHKAIIDLGKLASASYLIVCYQDGVKIVSKLVVKN